MKTKKTELKVPTWQANIPCARNVNRTLGVHMRLKGSFWREFCAAEELVLCDEDETSSTSGESSSDTAV